MDITRGNQSDVRGMMGAYPLNINMNMNMNMSVMTNNGNNNTNANHNNSNNTNSNNKEKLMRAYCDPRDIRWTQSQMMYYQGQHDMMSRQMQEREEIIQKYPQKYVLDTNTNIATSNNHSNSTNANSSRNNIPHDGNRSLNKSDQNKNSSKNATNESDAVLLPGGAATVSVQMEPNFPSSSLPSISSNLNFSSATLAECKSSNSLSGFQFSSKSLNGFSFSCSSLTGFGFLATDESEAGGVHHDSVNSSDSTTLNDKIGPIETEAVGPSSGTKSTAEFSRSVSVGDTMFYCDVSAMDSPATVGKRKRIESISSFPLSSWTNSCTQGDMEEHSMTSSEDPRKHHSSVGKDTNMSMRSEYSSSHMNGKIPRIGSSSSLRVTCFELSADKNDFKENKSYQKLLFENDKLSNKMFELRMIMTGRSDHSFRKSLSCSFLVTVEKQLFQEEKTNKKLARSRSSVFLTEQQKYSCHFQDSSDLERESEFQLNAAISI